MKLHNPLTGKRDNKEHWSGAGELQKALNSDSYFFREIPWQNDDGKGAVKRHVTDVSCREDRNVCAWTIVSKSAEEPSLWPQRHTQ